MNLFQAFKTARARLGGLLWLVGLLAFVVGLAISAKLHIVFAAMIYLLAIFGLNRVRSQGENITMISLFKLFTIVCALSSALGYII